MLAFGNPFGFRFTVTRGIVSALNRPNPSSDDARKPGQFIQTDAAINQGNSGGPLVNARGEVIGINTFLISPSGSFSGMGFAIPTQIVRPTVEKLIQFGKVTHGYMGIGIADVTPENSKFFHMDNAVGAVVSQVEPDSPGAKGGLKVGDVITQLDGREVSDAGDCRWRSDRRIPARRSTFKSCEMARGFGPGDSGSDGQPGQVSQGRLDAAQASRAGESGCLTSRLKCASNYRRPATFTERSSSRCSPAARPTMLDCSPVT